MTDSPSAKTSVKKDPWYAPGMSFKCTQCGNCCTGGPGYVWFDEAEGRAMAEHLGLSVEAFYEKYAHRTHGKWSLDEVKVGRNQFDCIFLEHDEKGHGRCSIYPVRPTQCRTWPFWASNMRSPRAWAEAAKGCPGMNVSEGQGDSRGNFRGNFVPIERIRVLMDSNPKGL